MDRFIIDGGTPLRGDVRISGSKNAALPILIATLLTDESCVIENVPTRLRDIRLTFRVLEAIGKRVDVSGSRVVVHANKPLKTRAPYDLVKQMRASVLVAGPLLSRFGWVRVPIPGGCAIGLRPIDIHIQGFQDLGARRVVRDRLARGLLDGRLGGRGRRSQRQSQRQVEMGGHADVMADQQVDRGAGQ